MPNINVISIDTEPSASRPALYNSYARSLDLFESYHVFQEHMEEWMGRYGHIPGADTVIEDTVLEVYSGMLLARVMHATSLRGTPCYNEDAMKLMLSPDSLAIAVMGFRDAELIIKQKLSGKLGRMAEAMTKTS